MPFSLYAWQSTMMLESAKMLPSEDFLLFCAAQKRILLVSIELIWLKGLELNIKGGQAPRLALQSGWESQQFLFMKINFDELHQGPPAPLTPSKASPIKIEIESPIYEKVYKSVSPYNYRNQLDDIGHLISIPEQVSSFILHEIHKQIQIQTAQNSKQEESFEQELSQEVSQPPHQPPHQPQKTHKSSKAKQTKLNWVYNYKKHKCENKMDSQLKRQLNSLTELTLKPKLYASKMSQKVIEQRKSSAALGKKFNIYDSLYKDATKRQIKRNAILVQDQNEKDEKKPPTNDYFTTHNKKYKPIFSRLNDILEVREKRRAEQQTLDLASGREMFKPNLNSSRESYKLFSQSLSREKLHTKKKVIEPKKESEPKQKINKQQQSIDDRTVDFFIGIFYPDGNEDSQMLNGLESMRQKQFTILQPFLHLVEEIESKCFEQETNISSSKVPNNKSESVMSRSDFKERFARYYKSLTLHDRQILRSEVLKRKREKIKLYQQIEMGWTHRPSINVRSSSLDNLSKGHTHHIYFV